MSETQTQESINKLKEINIWRIDNDSPWKNKKLDEVNSILDSIINSKKASKDELKEIINILKTETSVSGLDMIVYHNLVHRIHDFENLLKNFKDEENLIIKETQSSTYKNKESVESNVYTGLLTMESRIKNAKDIKELDILRKELININKSERRLWVVNEINLLQEKITKKYAELNNSKNKVESLRWKEIKKQEKEIKKNENPAKIKSEQKEKKQTNLEKEELEKQETEKKTKEELEKVAALKKPKETIDSISNYFNINKKDLENLNNKINENELNLDIVQFLSEYKNYIETNLNWLDEKILEKIKKAIWLKIKKLSSIIEERIKWVDKKVKSWDYKKEDRKKEIQNQRWIINQKLTDLFSDFNNKVLPSACVINNKLEINVPKDANQIRKMFSAELTEDWDFNKDWTYFEIIDSNTNSWSVIDSTDEKHKNFMEKNKISSIEWTSLLNEKDKEIEKKATIYWYWALAWLITNDLASFTWVWTIPWATIWIAYDWYDVFSDEDAWLLLLRKSWLIDENYRMEKTWIDNVLASIWIIPWMTALTKSKKLASFTEKLPKADLKYFEEAKNKTSEYIKNLFKKDKKSIVDEKMVPDESLWNINKWLEKLISDEAYDNFIHNKKIDREILEWISLKFQKWEELTPREQAVKIEFSKEIEEILKKAKENTTETFTKTEKKIHEPKSDEFIDLSKLSDDYGKISSYASKKFKELFQKTIKEKSEISVWEKTYKKRKDWKYEIEWDLNIYKEKEILAKISNEDKISFLEKEAKNRVYTLWEKTIKLKDWFFDFWWKYKVSQNEILFKENWSWRKLSEIESDKFYKDNFEDLLKKTKWIDVNKVAEDTSKSFLSKILDTKLWKIWKATDEFAESIPVAWHLYILWRWISIKALNEMLTPYNIVKWFKEAKWFKESTKAIIFWNKDIWVIWGTAKVWTYAVVPTFLEQVREKNINEMNNDDWWKNRLSNLWWDMDVNAKNMASNYLEFMYLWVINSIIIELLWADEKIWLWKPEETVVPVFSEKSKLK